ncbi:hypothetical protein GALL_502430 [mine drainage metagenome]|uniref:Uncharacterized protein n=1 Tax=mine drainage metagenome TaxID=410659 RepID=A0A1J5P983_9ZZZZ
MDAATGTMVSAISSDAPSANTMVSATGLNSLPSSPSRLSSGRNTMAMIATPDSTGAATSPTPCRMRVSRSVVAPPRVASCTPGRSCAMCVTRFSTTTTAASTSMPSAIARPPRLIRLALKPAQRISTKVASADSGRVMATTVAARQFPRNSSSITTTSTTASPSASSTVPTARSTSWLRS